MRITGYRTLSTVHDWGRPIGDANGAVRSGTTEVPIVLLSTDSGETGVGLGSTAHIEDFFPLLDGADPRAAPALYDRMLARVFKAGHAGAVFGTIGALDMALWDLKAKAAGEPLWRTLGAADRVVPAYASALDGPLSDDELVAAHQPFAERGFGAVKLKGGLDAATDIRRLRLADEVYAAASGGRPALMLDANETWSRKEAVRHVRRIEEELDLAWVEEPVRRWDAEGLAAVSRGVRAAVATGENLTGLEQFRPLVLARAVDIVQTGSIWGITHFLRVAALAHSVDLPISPVGYNANPLCHAAAVVPNHMAVEIQDLGFPQGISADQTFEDGRVVLGDSPGLGLVVDEEAVTRANGANGWTAPASPHVRPSDAGRRLTRKPDPRRG
ncbi:mandelate racemase/muconate lactonizing enzyme family protein [Streptomyces sp. NA04227]|uniref:mandelate racemase/muconate lactonizing enzyme family protein n=1 Tax=Streptomyces sp. NA04227 TaxID=2742136 RepID=UPI0015910A62|nr:mandelate racemase/muconate lactonizing enzyme family protein [Streptomyces sp. NA04227]QKW10372.1 mandelate racemase/muconate lactonizing enzyme family protein [Streptomyces sp. NA04227]